MKTCLVHFDAILTAHIGRQIQRKSKRVVQFEGHITGQYFYAARQGSIQDFHAGCQRLKEALFLNPQHVGNAFLLRSQVGVGRAHHHHQIRHQLVEKRRLLPQLVAMANSPTDDAALHITAPFIARQYAITNQKCRGTNVVGNHA